LGSVSSFSALEWSVATSKRHSETSPRTRRLAGLKGYVTNIPANVMPAAEVIAKYHDLWVRREALVDRVEVRGLHRGSVAAGLRS